MKKTHYICEKHVRTIKTVVGDFNNFRAQFYDTDFFGAEHTSMTVFETSNQKRYFFSYCTIYMHKSRPTPFVSGDILFTGELI